MATFGEMSEKKEEKIKLGKGESVAIKLSDGLEIIVTNEKNGNTTINRVAEFGTKTVVEFKSSNKLTFMDLKTK